MSYSLCSGLIVFIWYLALWDFIIKPRSLVLENALYSTTFNFLLKTDRLFSNKAVILRNKKVKNFFFIPLENLYEDPARIAIFWILPDPTEFTAFSGFLPPFLIFRIFQQKENFSYKTLQIYKKIFWKTIFPGLINDKNVGRNIFTLQETELDHWFGKRASHFSSKRPDTENGKAHKNETGWWRLGYFIFLV